MTLLHGKIMIEIDYLIQTAVDRFNFQYGEHLTYDEMRIFSISPEENSDLGYELFTIRQDDYVRLRLFILLGQVCDTPYRLETDNTFIYDGLGDEVFCTIHGIDAVTMAAEGFKFPWLTLEAQVPFNTLSTEDFIPLITEDGLYLLAEGQ